MKTTVTENYYTNCPNCGATLQPDDKTCPYCGTYMVKNRSVSESDGQEINYIAHQNVYYSNGRNAGNGAAGNDTRRVDIISQADPDQMGSGSTVLIVFLVFWICSTFIGAITAFISTRQMFAMSSMFGFPGMSFSGGFLALLVPVGMGTLGLIFLIFFLKKRSAGRMTLASAPRYDAVVLAHSKTSDLHRSENHSYTQTKCSVKVLANIDGRETCILIKSKLPNADIAYPVGCHITIAGRDTMFMIVE